jgi:hypothetical protein
MITSWLRHPPHDPGLDGLYGYMLPKQPYMAENINSTANGQLLSLLIISKYSRALMHLLKATVFISFITR